MISNDNYPNRCTGGPIRLDEKKFRRNCKVREMSEFGSRNTEQMPCPVSDQTERVGGAEDFKLQDSDDQTERVEWLKSRGVEIEFPEDRKRESKDSSAPTRSTVVVLIPWDASAPYREVVVEYSDNGAGDRLVHALKPYFKGDSSNIDLGMLNETAKSQFGSSELPKISTNTLSLLAQEGSVEAFPLSHACEDNNYTQVSLYLDEVGRLKNLPFNSRASALANTCGLKNVQLAGDMYVGRIRLFPKTGIKHENFRLADLDSDAVWLRGIEKLNYEWGLKTNKVAMESHDALDNKGEDKDNNYTWHETVLGIEVRYKLPPGVTKKEINVAFKTAAILITNKVTKSNLLEIKKLKGNIRPDESTWTINDGCIELTMEKVDESVTWGSLV